MSQLCFLADKERSKFTIAKVVRIKQKKIKHSMISNIHHGTESLPCESASAPTPSTTPTATKGNELTGANDPVELAWLVT